MPALRSKHQTHLYGWRGCDGSSATKRRSSKQVKPVRDGIGLSAETMGDPVIRCGDRNFPLTLE
jgi:hypothetical protein